MRAASSSVRPSARCSSIAATVPGTVGSRPALGDLDVSRSHVSTPARHRVTVDGISRK